MAISSKTITFRLDAELIELLDSCSASLDQVSSAYTDYRPVGRSRFSRSAIIRSIIRLRLQESATHPAFIQDLRHDILL